MSLFSRLLRFHGGAVRLEDYFTEIFAHLLSTYPDLCLAWLSQSGVVPENEKYSRINVTTQQSFGALEAHRQSSRPDVVIELYDGFSPEMAHDERSEEATGMSTDVVFVESKIGSREGDEQLKRYAEQLSEIPGVRRRKLVYVTRGYDPKDADEIVGGLRGSCGDRAEIGRCSGSSG